MRTQTTPTTPVQGCRSRRAAAMVLVATSLLVGACGGSDGSDTSSTTTAGGPATGARGWIPGMPTTSDAAAPSTSSTVGGEAPPTTTQPPATTAPVGPPVLPVDAKAVDRSNPEAVAKAVVHAWFTYNTALDKGPGAGPARASALLTAKLRAQVAIVLPGQGAEWSTWASRNALTAPLVGPAQTEGQKPTALAASYKFSVQIVPVTADGKPVGETARRIVAVALANSPTGWEVDDVTEL